MQEASVLVSYGVDDIEAARRRRTVFITWFIVLSVVTVAGVAVAAALRSLVFTIGLTIVGGGAMIFVWDAMGTPVLSYMRFLQDHRRGLTHANEGVFIAWGDVSMRDGLPCHELLLDVNGERLEFFLDIKKPRPALNPGDTVSIVTHNKAIISMRLPG